MSQLPHGLTRRLTEATLPSCFSSCTSKFKFENWGLLVVQLETHTFVFEFDLAYPLGRVKPSRSASHNAEVQRGPGFGWTGARVFQIRPKGQSDTRRLGAHESTAHREGARRDKGGATPVKRASDHSQQHRMCLCSKDAGVAAVIDLVPELRTKPVHQSTGFLHQCTAGKYFTYQLALAISV